MDRDYLPFIVMFLVGIAMVIVAQVGERLGWNDLGTLGTYLGLPLSALGIALAFLLGATKGEGRSVAREVRALARDVREGFGASLRRHDETNQILREHRDMMARQGELLGQIPDRL
jgi:hypothetical protein